MSEFIKCPLCKGAKKIKGLGGIEKNCAICNGVGHVAAIVDKPTLQVTASEDVPKRRGRPARLISQVVL